jgi:Zn-dependent peptidase ImmA (M78 family)
MKFYRNEQIEQIAERRLHEFERKLERPLSLPIDIELLGELVLELSILWDEIEELPGEEVLAGLRVPDRLIVMNERRKQEMEAKPGRRRLTQGHEMGHWDLFVDKSKLDHPSLFEAAVPSIFAYRTSTGGGQVQIMKTLLGCEEGRDLLRQINSRADAPDEARSVNRYAAAILMPRSMITDEAKKIDSTQWPNLYRLAERFGVTISALRVRLEQFNLVYLDQGTKKLYPSRDDAQGQARLLF